jgi:penicillin-binding protein 1A
MRRPQSAWGWFLHFLATGLFLPIQLLTLGLLASAIFVDAILPDLPDVSQGLRHVQLQEPLRVYSADAALIAEFGVERRSPVSYDEIPRCSSRPSWPPRTAASSSTAASTRWAWDGRC